MPERERKTRKLAVLNRRIVRLSAEEPLRASRRRPAAPATRTGAAGLMGGTIDYEGDDPEPSARRLDRRRQRLSASRPGMAAAALRRGDLRERRVVPAGARAPGAGPDPA